jgi:cobalt-zinc-cadmium efflux system protein
MPKSSSQVEIASGLGLGVAWSAAVLTKRAPTQRFTYGLGGTSILAALFNASFLLVVIGGLSSLVSVGVVIAGFVILLTGCLLLDPAVSLIINAIIIWGTWGSLERQRDDVAKRGPFQPAIARGRRLSL